MSEAAQNPGESSRSPAHERRRGWPRLILAGGLAALLPKCLACVVGYLALATGFAATSPELCGAVAAEAASPVWPAGAATGLIFGGAFCLLARNRPKRSVPGR